MLNVIEEAPISGKIFGAINSIFLALITNFCKPTSFNDSSNLLVQNDLQDHS